MSGGKRVAVGSTGETVMETVRAVRERRGLSTTRLAAALKEIGQPIPATGITRIEKGQRRVDVDDLVALAQVLGVRTDYLLTGWCARCEKSPPHGFTCNQCGAT